MAYTKKNPKLISGNMLHFGSLSGACELLIPCGWNQIKIHTNKTEKIVVNCGFDDNYSNTGGGVPPSELIIVPTYYQEIPNSVLVQLASATVVTVEVVENKGIVSGSYYSKINKNIYSKFAGVPITNPIDVTVAINENARFFINNDYVSYQWELSTDNGETWNNSTADGATTYQISFTPNNVNMTGRLYRCKIINTFGKVEYSSAAKLTVTAEANNSKSNDTPTVEELEQDDNVLKIDVPANEAKEIFENLEKEGE